MVAQSYPLMAYGVPETVHRDQPSPRYCFVDSGFISSDDCASRVVDRSEELAHAGLRQGLPLVTGYNVTIWPRDASS